MTTTPNEDPKPAAPQPGTPEHDAALTATFDKSQAAPADPTPAPEKPTRPDHVPEKFWDADKGEVKWADIAALDTPPAEAPKTDAAAPKSEAVQGFEKATEEGAKALTDVGLDYAKFAKSYETNGKLTDADYAEMEAKNIPRSVVDAHIAGLVAHGEAEAAAIRSSIFEVVGGEAKYGELVKWAGANVPASELAAFNAVVDTGSVDALKLAVQGLQGRMTAAQGQDPTLVQGSRAAVLDVYESTYQMTQDMKDPQYAKDPAFRAKVQAKLARSNIM